MKKIIFIISICLATASSITSCKKDKTPPKVPSVTTAALTNVTTTSATAGGTITGNGGAAITASGVVWSKTNNIPTLLDSVKTGITSTGSFTNNLTGLDFNTTYYIRAYATNSVGTGYGNVVTLTTANDTTKVQFTYNGQTVTYGVIISSVTGKKWMDRNLGASNVATSLTDTAGYGDLFQWGRLADGHQLRTSTNLTGASSTDNPGNNKFIVPSNTTTRDWRDPQNNNLWQGVSGVNNPCPSGWRLPTKTEYEAEMITDPNVGFDNLKLVLAGFRSRLSGSINAGSLGTQGHYWTSSIDVDATTTPPTQMSYEMAIYSGNTGIAQVQRGVGNSVRCIRE